MNEKRWHPPDENYRKELIGKSNRTEDENITPYVDESYLLICWILWNQITKNYFGLLPPRKESL